MNNPDRDKVKLEDLMSFPLYACSREVIKKYRPYLDELNLTYTQYIVMMVFWEKKRINVKELGKKLYLDSGTLTPVLKSLEAKGLVSRYRSAEDERVLIVEITESGEKLKERALSVPQHVANCVKLDSDEEAALYSSLYKILEMLDKEQN